MFVRKPAVAGYFYPSSPKEILSEIKEFMPTLKGKEAYGAICPHAGYVYSGSVAGAVYAQLKPKEVFILLGPNHTGYGKDVSIMPEGEWEIPLGKLSIHQELAEKILKHCPFASSDIKAHLHEHSLEVQLPFIYYLNPNAKIVPITLKALSLDDSLSLAQSIGESLKESALSEKAIIISSTDMSHYLPDDLAKKVDALAIEKIKNFDPSGLYETVFTHQISMCGVIPTVVMLFATKILGATHVEIVKYTTSAEVNRDYERVVGYLGAIAL